MSPVLEHAFSRGSHEQHRPKLFEQDAPEFRLSRVKVELFVRCPCCFWFDRKIGIHRPSGLPFTLNSRADELTKNEFDLYRLANLPPRFLQEAGYNLIPLQHPQMAEWQDSLRRGLSIMIPGTNIRLTGGVDDILYDPFEGLLYLTDYKTTVTHKVISMDDQWKQAYKRQIEMYQYMLREMIKEDELLKHCTVSDYALFIFSNGHTGQTIFGNRIDFDTRVIPHLGDDSWVVPAVQQAYACLCSDVPPMPSKDCEYCGFLEQRNGYVQSQVHALSDRFDY